jgi:hypothetical protein
MRELEGEDRMDSVGGPRFVFVSFFPKGPHAGPVSIGLFGMEDGARLLPLFRSREKAISFAINTLGAPPSPDESWDGVELSSAELLQLVLEDGTIGYVAEDPAPSGETETVPVRDFAERLSREIEDPETFEGDFRRRMIQLLTYGDVG